MSETAHFVISNPDVPVWEFDTDAGFASLKDVFENWVREPFDSHTAIDQESGHSDPVDVRMKAANALLPPKAARKFPEVIFENEFEHQLYEWVPVNTELNGVPREREFLRRVEWFFGTACQDDQFVLAGVEEPRTAVRRFLEVNLHMLSDEIRINVDAGDLFVRSPDGKSWNKVFSELWLCSSDKFDSISEGFNWTRTSKYQQDYNSIEEKSKAKQFRPKQGGEKLVWKHLDELKSDDPEIFMKFSKAALSRKLADHKDFRPYQLSTIETYVRRVLASPDFET